MKTIFFVPATLQIVFIIIIVFFFNKIITKRKSISKEELKGIRKILLICLPIIIILHLVVSIFYDMARGEIVNFQSVLRIFARLLLYFWPAPITIFFITRWIKNYDKANNRNNVI